MKYIAITLLISLPVLASTSNCNPLPATSTDQLDVAIAIPNCLKPRPLSMAIGPKRNSQSLCGCKAEFEQKSMLPPLTALTKTQKQELFLETMLKEYEKVQINNLVEIAKLSSIDQQGQLQFQRSIAACQFKTQESLAVGCNSNAAKDLLKRSPIFSKYQERIANEFLNIMSPLQSTPRPALLDRSQLYLRHSAKACPITEIETMKFTSQALETIIAPELLERLKVQMQNHPMMALTDVFEAIGVDSSFENLLRQHPMIRLHMKSRQQLLSLLNAVPAPYSKQDLNSALLSPQNANLLDVQLADSCGSSFNGLKAALCSDKFESGEIELDPFGNLSKLGITIPGSLPQISASSELVYLNQQVLKFCPWTNNPKAQSLTDSTKSLSELLEGIYSGMSREEYATNKFNQEISTTRDQICSSKSQPCTADMDIVTRHSCLAAQLWRESQTTPALSPETLAQRPIAELMRGFLPAAESLNPETKQALARIGIIPTPLAQRPTGAQVAQAATEVERFNPQFTSVANATLPRTQAVGNSPQQIVTGNFQPRNPAAIGASPYSAQLAEVMTQKQKMFEESNETYRGIIDQLVKRRMDNPSREEVTQAVTEEFNRASKPFNPNSREGKSFINNIVNNYPQAVRQNNSQAISRPFEQDRVAQVFDEAINATNSVVTTPTRQVGSTDINSIAASARLSTTSTSNGLEKVVVTDPSLNLTDPKLAQVLQTVLTLNENGEMLQEMLDQRKDFILKLNTTEVMMDFDPSAQTYRIRPMGVVPQAVITSLNQFMNNYSLISRVREGRHTTISGLVQELQKSQSSF